MAELTIKSGAKYQQYEEYKESGVKWLSQLPVGWDVERTKRMLCLRRELVGANSLDYQLLSLTLRGVVPRDISNGDGKIPADFSTYQEVEEKDLIFCLFDIDETPRTVGLSPEKGMITGAYNVYQTSDRCSSRYAYYYFLHIDLRKGLRPFYTGLRKVVRSETFGNIKMPCPSYEEQTKIANFLDHETAQIDTLIKKQQTLIQLLKEKRQAVISHAVTKGLNPDAPMKDSGVEWLGEVPEHWEVTKAKYISDIFIPQRNKPELNAIEGCPWVTMEDMKSQYIDEVHRYVKIEAMQESGSKVLKTGAVIASCVGNFGVTSINRVDVIINQQLQAFQPKRIKPEYLQAIVELSKSYFELIGTAATLIYVNREGFENLPVIVPTTQEQEAISEFINIKSKQFDLLVSKAEQAIQLMQERRTALISAAVTGKVDVRGWRVPDVEL